MRFQLNEKSPLFTKNALFSMNLWLNFHPNYHHAFSSISRVTNFWKMHLIQQTTIIIHGTHNLIFPFETDCVNLIIMAPGLQSVLYWLEDIIDIFQADIWNMWWILKPLDQRMFPIFLQYKQGFLSIQKAFQRPRYSF